MDGPIGTEQARLTQGRLFSESHHASQFIPNTGLWFRNMLASPCLDYLVMLPTFPGDLQSFLNYGIHGTTIGTDAPMLR